MNNQWKWRQNLGLLIMIAALAGCARSSQKLSVDNADRLTQTGILQGHEGKINAIAYTGDGTLLASGDGKSSIRVWDVQQKKQLTSLDGPTGGVSDMIIDPKGTTIIAISGNYSQDKDFKKLRQWNVKTYAEESLIGQIDWAKKKAEIASQLAMSPDGKWLAMGFCEGPKLNPSGMVCGIAGVVLVSTSTDDPTASAPVCPFGTGTTVFKAQFSPDGTLLAVTGGGSVVVCNFDAQGGQIQFSQNSKYRTFGVAFSPDGKQLAVGKGDNTVSLFDIAAKKEVTVLQGHTKPVISVAFSPDGSLLASGSVDKTIKLWNVKTGEVRATLNGHDDYVIGLAFSPDGLTLASGSYDKTIRLWGIP